MARIDLNIVDRGTKGTDWMPENTGLTAGDLDKVMEMRTDNSGALNSLPTPFARFFVAKEAFRRMHEQRLNPKNEAGEAYKRLISDILDVYEILFNLKFHTNNSWKNGEKLEVREWDMAENLKEIKAKMPVLYNAVSSYYPTDIKEEKLYFIVFVEDGHEYLLGCSSPLTGFVTPPDMDKSIVRKKTVETIKFADPVYDNLHIHRKSGGEYFRDVLPLENREADFKNYLYNTLFGGASLDDRLKSIKEYIRSFKDDTDIKLNCQPKSKPILTDENNPLEINGITIEMVDEIDVNSFFTDKIIKLPYRIDRKRFKAVNFKADSPQRTYDYLLPFKPEICTLFPDGNIDSKLQEGRTDITVYLNYNGKEYKKVYATTPLRSSDGEIVDLSMASINFDLGIFPNILSYKELENNYFKVFLHAVDEDKESHNLHIDKIELSFYRCDGEDFTPIDEMPRSAKYGVLEPVVRSVQETEDIAGGTKLYELFNTQFDVIKVQFLGNSGLLIPVWEKSQATNDTYTYAIDLGTSNTFISRCQTDVNRSPEMFTIDRPMVSYLHETPVKKQLSLAAQIEDAIFDAAKARVKTEFLPPIIDGDEYKFPIRTAICAVNRNNDKPALFDNHNIAFFYEKLMAMDDQVVLTDIKWDENDSKLRVFIRELLLIIKCDILQRNGDLDRTRIVWFRPLSFMGNTKAMYDSIWTEEPTEILKVAPEQVSCFSESEAPYYYYKKKDYIEDSDAVTVIDIGGGSTDFVYFEDNRPKMANSVHFGCDVLWGNGYTEFEDEKRNGIYTRYADTMRFENEELESLNECFKSVDNATTKDIINFWLSNAQECDIMRNLNQDFKPVFAYHFTAILFYMANMFKDNGLKAPKTVLFSGNGSKYIDGFICKDSKVLRKIINLVFSAVFGGEHNVHLQLPSERKEATCYGGLYRDPDAETVPAKVYQGDIKHSADTVGDINKNLDAIKSELLNKYDQLTTVYKGVLDLLKKELIIDNTANTLQYVEKAAEDMETPFRTYYKTQVQEKYGDEVELFDSIFFIPIIDRVFEMTKI